MGQKTLYIIFRGIFLILDFRHATREPMKTAKSNFLKSNFLFWLGISCRKIFVALT